MLTLEQLQKALQLANILGLSRETGVSRRNITRVKNGDNTVPYSDIQKLSAYFGEE